MSDNVQIALIIGVVFVIVLSMFKGKLGSVLFSADKKGMKAEIHSQQNSGITISGNTLSGDENEIDVRKDNVTLEDNRLKGNGNKINVGTNTSKSNQNG